MATNPPELPSTDFDAPRVKRIRGALGLSQVDFAVSVGVHFNSVVRWETGKTKPTRADVIHRLLLAEQRALATLQAASRGVT